MPLDVLRWRVLEWLQRHDHSPQRAAQAFPRPRVRVGVVGKFISFNSWKSWFCVFLNVWCQLLKCKHMKVMFYRYKTHMKVVFYRFVKDLTKKIYFSRPTPHDFLCTPQLCLIGVCLSFIYIYKYRSTIPHIMTFSHPRSVPSHLLHGIALPWLFELIFKKLNCLSVLFLLRCTYLCIVIHDTWRLWMIKVWLVERRLLGLPVQPPLGQGRLGKNHQQAGTRCPL